MNRSELRTSQLLIQQFNIRGIITKVYILASQNKSSHHTRRQNDDGFFKTQKAASYRSFQPVSIGYHKSTNPRADDRSDYDITSYDTEYGAMVANFTSSIYDDNPQLYPNPEFISRSNQGKIFIIITL